jgi:hypothetical protein
MRTPNVLMRICMWKKSMVQSDLTLLQLKVDCLLLIPRFRNVFVARSVEMKILNALVYVLI